MTFSRVRTYLSELSKIELIQGDVQLGLDLLEKARKFAEDYNLPGLLKTIAVENESYVIKIAKWQELLKVKTTLQEKLDNVEMRDYINSLISIKQNFK